jgi:integrase
MFKFLFFTAVRVSELVNVKVADIDMGNCKVFIDQAKGAKDRYILFPASFRLTLATHLQANPKNRYLFESSRFGPYTTRRIQQIVQEYRAKAGIENRVTCHTFRHQMITWLTRSGLTDAQIQLVSGHASKKSLEVYQHLGLESVEAAYQEAAQVAEAGLNGNRHQRSDPIHRLSLAVGSGGGDDPPEINSQSRRLSQLI